MADERISTHRMAGRIAAGGRPDIAPTPGETAIDAFRRFREAQQAKEERDLAIQLKKLQMQEIQRKIGPVQVDLEALQMLNDLSQTGFKPAAGMASKLANRTVQQSIDLAKQGDRTQLEYLKRTVKGLTPATERSPQSSEASSIPESHRLSGITETPSGPAALPPEVSSEAVGRQEGTDATTGNFPEQEFENLQAALGQKGDQITVNRDTFNLWLKLRNQELQSKILGLRLGTAGTKEAQRLQLEERKMEQQESQFKRREERLKAQAAKKGGAKDQGFSAAKSQRIQLGTQVRALKAKLLNEKSGIQAMIAPESDKLQTVYNTHNQIRDAIAQMDEDAKKFPALGRLSKFKAPPPVVKSSEEFKKVPAGKIVWLANKDGTVILVKKKSDGTLFRYTAKQAAGF